MVTEIEQLTVESLSLVRLDAICETAGMINGRYESYCSSCQRYGRDDKKTIGYRRLLDESLSWMNHLMETAT